MHLEHLFASLFMTSLNAFKIHLPSEPSVAVHDESDVARNLDFVTMKAIF